MKTCRPLAHSIIAMAVLAATQSPAAAKAEGMFPVGTAASSANLQNARGAVPYEGGWAIPLAGERPAWYTFELEQRVLAAGGTPVAAPTDAPLPSEIGIRPGSWMIAPAGCTMNFVFTKNGNFAIGTAGHCVDKTGEHVVLLTLAPGTQNPVLVDIGTVIARHDNGIGDDFALVAINPVLNPWVSATTAVIGGPCGQYTGFGPETVAHYGHGLVIGTGGTPRAGVALTWKQDAFGWDSPAIFGDSGSPVRVTALGAAGDLTHLVVDTRWLPSIIAGTRIGKMLQIAKGWSLVNSPLCAGLGGLELATHIEAAAPVTIVERPSPSPTAGSVRLKLALAKATNVEAEVFDIQGRAIATLHRGTLPGGTQTLSWDGRTRDGSMAAASVYFVQVRADQEVIRSKFVLVR